MAGARTGIVSTATAPAPATTPTTAIVTVITTYLNLASFSV